MAADTHSGPILAGRVSGHAARVFTTIALGIAIVACADPNAATEANFKSAVQRELDSRPLCLPVPLKSLPGTSTTKVLQRTQDQLQALVDAGLLHAEPTSIATKSLFGNAGSVPGFRYELTAQGRRFVPDAPPRDDDGDVSREPQLCFGKRKVTTIVRFTASSETNGMKSSDVVYRSAWTSLPDWTANPAMHENFRQLRDLSDQRESEQRMTLVLTGDGWRTDSANAPR